MTQTHKEYAKALFLLAVEKNMTDRVSLDLALIRDTIEEHKEYLEYLSCPAIALSERLLAIDKAFGDALWEFSLSFLKLLCENGHIKELSFCTEEYFLLQTRWQNRLHVQVTSVVALKESQKLLLCEKLERIYRKQLDISYTVDPSLLGGIRIETEDTVIDASVKQQLQKLKGVIKA